MAADYDSILRGLSNRPILPEDSGILFILPNEDYWQFWMKGIFMDLDAIFLNENREIVDIQTMYAEPPNTPDESLTIYEARSPARYAIEVNAGLARELGLGVGDTVVFQ